MTKTVTMATATNFIKPLAAGAARAANSDERPVGFHDHNGELWVDQVPLSAIAAEYGTPAYVYSGGFIRSRVTEFLSAFEGRDALFCYALKANHNLAIIRLIANAGAGADTVSGGEIERALAAGVAPGKIVLAGVAKGDDEIALALRHGILQLNIESMPELERINAVAASMGKTAPIAIRINPDVAAPTLAKISTGRKGDKFGIPLDELEPALGLIEQSPHLELQGLHLHIGSQINAVEPFERAYARGADMFFGLQQRFPSLTRLDFGGGFGVRYGDEEPLDPQALRQVVDRVLGGRPCRLVFEPGRSFVAEAGVMLASMIYEKSSAGRRFVILDAGMNSLIRPALYDAHHDIRPIKLAGGEPNQPADIVGPICESTDFFARDRKLHELQRGEIVAFMSAGAYGAVMTSDYNSRPSPAEVLVDGDQIALIKRRRAGADLFRDEIVPDWL